MELVLAKEVIKSLVVLTPDNCDEAVDKAIELAFSNRGETVVYLKYVEDSDPALDIYLKKEDFDKKRNRAEEVIEKQSRRIINAGIRVEVLEPYFGIASQEIVRVEKQMGLDIIIVVAPEMSTYQRILKGAHFSEDLVRRVMTPTLVIKSSPLRGIRVTESRKMQSRDNLMIEPVRGRKIEKVRKSNSLVSLFSIIKQPLLRSVSYYQDRDIRKFGSPYIWFE